MLLDLTGGVDAFQMDTEAPQPRHVLQHLLCLSCAYMQLTLCVICYMPNIKAVLVGTCKKVWPKSANTKQEFWCYWVKMPMHLLLPKRYLTA